MENLQINILSEIHFKIVDIDGVLLKVYKDGKIYRWLICGRWKLVSNVNNHSKGYNMIRFNNKCILRHRIMCYCFKELDLTDTKIQVDHINHDKLNNNIENLRLVTHQQNHFNRSNVKGYYFNKREQKYRASIKINQKEIHLGYYNTEEEAREAYLRAKEVYHVI